jgi:hypothetical protein
LPGAAPDERPELLTQIVRTTTCGVVANDARRWPDDIETQPMDVGDARDQSERLARPRAKAQ